MEEYEPILIKNVPIAKICSICKVQHTRELRSFFVTNSNHENRKLKKHGSQGREGDKKAHALSSSHLKESSMGVLTISIGSSF